MDPKQYPMEVRPLLEDGVVTEAQVIEAQERRKDNGKSVSHNLVELGHVTEDSLVNVWSRKYSIPKFESSQIKVDPELLRLGPRDFWKTNKMFPLRRDGRKLTVAIAGPPNILAIDEIRVRSGCDVGIYLVGPVTMERLLRAEEFDAHVAPASLREDPRAAAEIRDPRGGERERRETHTLVPVYFSTDRARGSGGAGSYEDYFTGARAQDGQLLFGRCTVSVPADHRIGKVERPSWLRLEFREDERKHVVITNITEYPARAFYGEIREYLESERELGVLVFVHGFNVAFADAVRRTAQISYDLDFKGPTVCFSWPSEASIKAYLTDENNARWAVPHFEQFMKALDEEGKASLIHVIAHSMGSRVLAEALPGITEQRRMQQVIFAAPDIDADVFKELVGKYRHNVNRTTLYASSNDEALKLSKSLHGDYARAGETTDGVLVVQGVDSIDASSVNTGLLGHSYYGDNRSIISDIFELLRRDRSPRDRFGMQPIMRKGGGTYWAFRP